jgi:hypothetical protein
MGYLIQRILKIASSDQQFRGHQNNLCGSIERAAFCSQASLGRMNFSTFRNINGPTRRHILTASWAVGLNVYRRNETPKLA